MIEHAVGSYSIDPLPTYVSIGNYSSVGEKCYFHHRDNHACIQNRNLVATTDTWGSTGDGHITIGNDVWIGYGVSILDGVMIGDGSIIGAHSVVASDVEPFSVIVGNPARVTRKRFSDDQISCLQMMKWWDWSVEVFHQRKKDFEDIDFFINKYLSL